MKKKGITWVRVYKEKFKNLKTALKLQAKEYERRLDELNNENSRIKDVQKDSIPREVFDRTMDELRKMIEANTSWRTKQEGRSQLLQYIPWIIAIIAIVANWIRNK